ncbi:acetyl-CoA C-acyltransferase [Acaricomes phytoseiuli]|uniref:thiolase family protein n=1 Tax=Acaricomes phytoseiuli TaxID=291968 RepID=UPI00036566EF|nr:acetyl-CoA C-acyltransferase [Acaricomes phytoseiuli]MCW1250521.1 acetyl-CoA C-acyltransferase [Acaricomes phytoseiuli]
MSEAFLVDGLRTPIGRYAGALAGTRPDDLAATVLRAVVERAGADPEAIDEVILGNANQAGEDNRNIARMALLLAGLPQSVPGLTVNRLCASGMSAISLAAQMIQAGAADLVLAGGVESMSRAPWVMAKPEKAFAKPGEIFDTSICWRFTNPRFSAEETLSMPETAEEVAALDGITREQADEFALESHQRAVAAMDAGRFSAEILPVDVRSGKTTVTMSADEGPRRDSSLAALAGLRPVVRPEGVVTAGNASSLNDGAAAVLIASDQAVRRFGLTPRARVLGSAAAGVEPKLMGLGPVPATEKVLTRTGTTIDQIGAVELNEAFASQALACIRRLGLDPRRVNADGGAIALGHPLGSSGARITVTLLGRMEREGAALGLATMCVGVGQGTALLLERA